MIYPAIIRAFIDVNDYNSQFVLSLNRGDSAKQLQIFLTVNGERYNPGEYIRGTLTAVREDGEIIPLGICQYLQDGRITYDIDTQLTGNSGKYDCQLVIKDDSDGSQIACARFRVIVEDLTMDTSNVAQSSEFVSLQGVLDSSERLLNDLTSKRDSGYFNGNGIHVMDRAFEGDGGVFYLGELQGNGNVARGHSIIDLSGRVFNIDSFAGNGGVASYSGVALKGKDGTTFWLADVEWGGTTALLKSNIIPIEGKEIAVGDFIIYTNCKIHRVETIATSSVVVANEGVNFKGEPGYTPQKGIDYFDGADGYTPQKGVDYFDGEAGYTPQKGVDYFDGEDGYTPQKGVDYFDGEDGYTPQKGVDYWTEADKTGIVNELSSMSVPKNQGVSNVGKILVVGADGNLTLTDMPSGEVSDIIGTIGENNAITITGDLADGTYIFRYENTDGSYTDIGTLIVGGVVEYAITSTLTNCTPLSANAGVIEQNGTATLTFTANSGYELPENVAVSGASYTWNMETGTLVLSNPTTDVSITIQAIVYTPYTNVLPLAQEYASTSPYVSPDGKIGYCENARISASKQTATYMGTGVSNVDTTALIPAKRGDVIRLKNCNMKVTPVNTTYGTFVYGFDSSKNIISTFNLTYNGIQNRVPVVIEGEEYIQFTLEPLEAWTSSDVDSVAYIMISTDDLNENSIITINEEITE